MKQLGIYQTETFEVNEEGYLVDILNDGEYYKIWLYHKDNNNKIYLYSVPLEGITHDAALKIVEIILQHENHMKHYAQKYLDVPKCQWHFGI